MRKFLLLLTGLLALQTVPNALARDMDLNVILAGEVTPGVYGQVQFGNAPRPVVVYERPRIVTVERRYAYAEPLYLHVPPTHARHWDRHCHAYHACGRSVYFVRSEEYEPRYHYERRHHDHGHRSYGHGHGHGHGHKHHNHKRH